MGTSVGFPGTDGVPDQGWKLYFTSLAMVIVAGLVVVARVATRIANGQIGADDWTIILALIFSVVLSVAIQLAVSHGYGMHKADLAPPALHAALRWFFIAQTPYKVVVCLNKISVLLLYKRIFITKSFQSICWAVLTLVVAWSVGAICATIFQCLPIAAAWDQSVKASCIDTDTFWVAYAVINIITDAIVLSLPVQEIFRLHLNMRERIMVCGVFMLGGFVVLCGIVRTTSVANSLQNKADTTWNFIPRGIWTLVEANVGIICACLPILKKPFSRGLSRVFGTAGKTTLSSAVTGTYNPGFQHNDQASKTSAKDLSRSRSQQALRAIRGHSSDSEHVVEIIVSKDNPTFIDTGLDFGFEDERSYRSCDGHARGVSSTAAV